MSNQQIKYIVRGVTLSIETVGFLAIAAFTDNTFVGVVAIAFFGFLVWGSFAGYGSWDGCKDE